MVHLSQRSTLPCVHCTGTVEHEVRLIVIDDLRIATTAGSCHDNSASSPRNGEQRRTMTLHQESVLWISLEVRVVRVCNVHFHSF